MTLNEPKKTSPWVYVGIGCLVIVVLGLAGLGTLGYLGYRKAKQFGEEMKDPKAREAKVKAVLGAEAIPEGYHAVIGFSIPFVMDMAMLSDKPPGADGQVQDLGERSFIYMSMLSQGGKDQQELRDFFEGKRDDAEALRRANINVKSKEVLKRGVIDQGGHKVLYLAQRGDVSMHGKHKEGITATLLVQCPSDSRMRMGFWLGPDPGGEDLAGTPADEGAIKDFMAHFKPCGS
jgi:hypothetical protein